ncbi:MAG: type II toxin-antitoxin system VapC family toxin [Thermoprotei archaeon]|nr:type II toxin-antitoxin system VapC family toxin [Thermoprotei archaeon]OYT54895.1 MAG: PIN domain nuclease [Desulfurococcales archaeon ex4484_217_2]
MIVIDASSLAKYVLKEEGWLKVEEYLFKEVCSIDHVIKEVANAIWKHATIHSRVSEETAETLYGILKKLVEENIVKIERQDKYVDEAFKIALQNKITVYDALYLAQAKHYGKLLTSDMKQAKIAEKLGIEVYVV